MHSIPAYLSYNKSNNSIWNDKLCLTFFPFPYSECMASRKIYEIEMHRYVST